MIESVRMAERLAEGKTKIVWAVDGDPVRVIIEHKDAITAGDGVRRHLLADKAAASCRTVDNCFRLLERQGVPTHYLRQLDERHSLVRRCHMIPIEVVVRRLASGSYLKRHPAVREGERFDPPLLELFLKDDLRHDPLVTAEQIVNDGVADAAEVAAMGALAQRAFAVLAAAWARQEVALVDLKIECGRLDDGTVVIADVIDNDSWRLWPEGRREKMLDKQVYRDLAEVTSAALAQVAANYARVAALTDSFNA